MINLGNFNTLSESVFKNKEKILQDIVEQVLQRPFVPEDAKDFNLVKMQGNPNTDFVLYKGITVGKIIMQCNFRNLPPKVEITFHPGANTWLDEKIEENKKQQELADQKEREEQDALWNELWQISMEYIKFKDAETHLRLSGFTLSKKEKG